MKNIFLYTALVLLLALAAAGCAANDDLAVPTWTETIPPTNTLAPSETATLPPPTETATPNINIEPIVDGSKFIVLSEIGFDRHFLVEISSGRTLEIQNTGHRKFHILGFSNGCNLVVRANDKLVQTDIFGNEIAELFSFNYDEEEFLCEVSPSPNLNVVAYALCSGYQDYESFEYQDIYLQFADKSETVPITERRGGFVAEWSSDGAKLAYSDYDENGIEQLYLIDSSGNNRRQLTSFTDLEIGIGRIRWSEENRQVLFEYFPGSYLNELVLVNFLGNENEFQYIDGFSEIREFWWYSDTLIVLQATKNDGTNARGIFLVDITNNKISNEFLESQIGDESFILIKPFGSSSNAGFFIYDTLYVYDLDQSQAHRYEHLTRHVDFGDWFALPNSYSDLEYCDQYFP